MQDLEEIGFADLEDSVRELLDLAEAEIQEHRIQNQRSERIKVQTDRIIATLTPLVEQIKRVLEEYLQVGLTESSIRRQLEDYLPRLNRMIEDAPYLAAVFVDRGIFQSELQLLEKRQNEKLREWRVYLKQEILTAIAAETNFFRATDMALVIRSCLEDLRAIHAVPEVVQMLLDKINELDRDRDARQVPLARVREGDTHENALFYQANVAIDNRTKAANPSVARLNLLHSKEEFLADPYAELCGRVLVVGGHDEMAAMIRSKLHCSQVQLDWLSVFAQPPQIKQALAHVAGADLIVVIDACIKSSLKDVVIQAIKPRRKPFIPLNTMSILHLLEILQRELKAKAFAQKFKKTSKTA